MRSLFMVLGVLAGCGEPVVCGDYTEERAGNCFGEPPQEILEPGQEGFVQALADQQPCVLGTPTGDLDLDLRCAAGACIGQSFGSAREALGDATCVPTGRARARCDWAELSAEVTVTSSSGQPTDADIVLFLQTNSSYGGVTDDGLGMYVPFSCFLEALPTPDLIGAQRFDGTYVINELAWTNIELRVTNGAIFGLGYSDIPVVRSIHLGSQF